MPDPWDVLPAAAGLVDRASLQRARDVVHRVHELEEQLRAAKVDLDVAVREAAAKNPEASGGALARALGVSLDAVRKARRG